MAATLPTVELSTKPFHVENESGGSGDGGASGDGGGGGGGVTGDGSSDGSNNRNDSNNNEKRHKTRHQGLIEMINRKNVSIWRRKIVREYKQLPWKVRPTYCTKLCPFQKRKSKKVSSSKDDPKSEEDGGQSGFFKRLRPLQLSNNESRKIDWRQLLHPSATQKRELEDLTFRLYLSKCVKQDPAMKAELWLKYRLMRKIDWYHRYMYAREYRNYRLMLKRTRSITLLRLHMPHRLLGSLYFCGAYRCRKFRQRRYQQWCLRFFVRCTNMITPISRGGAATVAAAASGSNNGGGGDGGKGISKQGKPETVILEKKPRLSPSSITTLSSSSLSASVALSSSSAAMATMTPASTSAAAAAAAAKAKATASKSKLTNNKKGKKASKKQPQSLHQQQQQQLLQQRRTTARMLLTDKPLTGVPRMFHKLTLNNPDTKVNCPTCCCILDTIDNVNVRCGFGSGGSSGGSGGISGGNRTNTNRSVIAVARGQQQHTNIPDRITEGYVQYAKIGTFIWSMPKQMCPIGDIYNQAIAPKTAVPFYMCDLDTLVQCYIEPYYWCVRAKIMRILSAERKDGGGGRKNSRDNAEGGNSGNSGGGDCAATVFDDDDAPAPAILDADEDPNVVPPLYVSMSVTYDRVRPPAAETEWLREMHRVNKKCWYDNDFTYCHPYIKPRPILNIIVGHLRRNRTPLPGFLLAAKFLPSPTVVNSNNDDDNDSGDSDGNGNGNGNGNAYDGDDDGSDADVKVNVDANGDGNKNNNKKQDNTKSDVYIDVDELEAFYYKALEDVLREYRISYKRIALILTEAKHMEMYQAVERFIQKVTEPTEEEIQNHLQQQKLGVPQTHTPHMIAHVATLDSLLADVEQLVRARYTEPDRLYGELCKFIRNPLHLEVFETRTRMKEVAERFGCAISHIIGGNGIGGGGVGGDGGGGDDELEGNGYNINPNANDLTIDATECAEQQRKNRHFFSGINFLAQNVQAFERFFITECTKRSKLSLATAATATNTATLSSCPNTAAKAAAQALTANAAADAHRTVSTKRSSNEWYSCHIIRNLLKRQSVLNELNELNTIYASVFQRLHDASDKRRNTAGVPFVHMVSSMMALRRHLELNGTRSVVQARAAAADLAKEQEQRNSNGGGGGGNNGGHNGGGGSGGGAAIGVLMAKISKCKNSKKRKQLQKQAAKMKAKAQREKERAANAANATSGGSGSSNRRQQQQSNNSAQNLQNITTFESELSKKFTELIMSNIGMFRLFQMLNNHYQYHQIENQYNTPTSIRVGVKYAPYLQYAPLFNMNRPAMFPFLERILRDYPESFPQEYINIFLVVYAYNEYNDRVQGIKDYEMSVDTRDNGFRIRKLFTEPIPRRLPNGQLITLEQTEFQRMMLKMVTANMADAHAEVCEEMRKMMDAEVERKIERVKKRYYS